MTILTQSYMYKPFCIPFLRERKGHNTILTPVYYCKDCDYMIEYHNQKIISKMQKEQGNHILLDGRKMVKKYKI